MRPFVKEAFRAVFFLIVAGVLAISQVGLAWADDPPPPVWPLSSPDLEPVTQWGASVPAPSLPLMQPVQMPNAMQSPSLVVQPLAQLPALPSLVAPLQPVAQWAKFDWPVVQTTGPRFTDFQGASAPYDLSQPLTSPDINLFLNRMTSAASADARWQAEEMLLTRDAKLVSQIYLDMFTVATGPQDLLAGAGLAISRWGSEGQKLGFSGANMGGAALTQDWPGLARQVFHWALDHTILQPPSAQAMTGPFVSTWEDTRPVQGPDFQGYSHVSVQTTYQPVFSQNPTGWFVFPDSYQETTVTHVNTSVTYNTSGAWNGGYVPQFTTPSYPQFTTPSYPQFTTPSYPQFTAPSYPQYTPPSYPRFTMPSFPQTYTPPSQSTGW